MIPITRPWLPPLDEYVELVREIWSTRMLSNFADFTNRLEEGARTSLAMPHVLAIVSADIGLVVTLKALELPASSPCFVSDFTFNSTINAAIWTGLEPVIVDVDPGSYNMSPESLREAMGRDGRPGVVLPTHVFGNPCDVDALHELADTHGSRLVFDAAHAYGSTRSSQPVGSFGDAEVFSLSGTKVVTSAEGGLVATKHDWLAERIVYLRAYGFQHDYQSRYVGLNGKLSELHAALGVLTLPHAEELVRKRLGLVAQYRSLLASSVTFQTVRDEDRSTYKDLSIDFGSESRRERIELALEAAGVQTKRYFVPLHTMAPYARYSHGPKPVTDAVHARTLCVPLYADLATSEVELICGIISSFPLEIL